MLTLNDVKNYLNITWSDEATDDKVKGTVVRAQSTVGGLIGIPGKKFVDLSENAESDPEGTEAEQLFLDACRYIQNDSFEDFRKNFADTITSLRVQNSVLDSESEAENA